MKNKMYKSVGTQIQLHTRISLIAAVGTLRIEFGFACEEGCCMSGVVSGGLLVRGTAWLGGFGTAKCIVTDPLGGADVLCRKVEDAEW